MSVNNEDSNLVPLGDYIEPCDERNRELSIKLSQGISNTKEFQTPKQVAENSNNDKIVRKGQFAYNKATTRNGEKISIAYRTGVDCTVSSAYQIFKITKTEKLNPYFLLLWFKRPEFDRYARYMSKGSAHEFFEFEDMCRVRIPLPSPDVQQKLVDTYNGLKTLAEQNEALSKPLTEACQAYIVDCKKKYQEVELGGYIEEIDERNTSNEITLTQGVDVNMQFIPAKREAADKEGTKIVRTGQFAFNKVVKANGTKLPIALRTGPDCIISSSYAVFQISNQELDAKFLRLWFSRSEVHRYCGFISQGTTRDVFSYNDLCNMKIPLPPPEVQKAIVDIYNCAEEAKSIASDARKKIKTLCPALVQRAINGKS